MAYWHVQSKRHRKPKPSTMFAITDVSGVDKLFPLADFLDDHLAGMDNGQRRGAVLMRPVSEESRDRAFLFRRP